ncbi:MAG: MATE family efflux transporter [Oscillospiraceae bacterium]
MFVLVCRWGVEGAAAATVLAQWLSGIGTAVYTLVRCPELRARREERRITGAMLRELLSASVLTCLQQSVMNLGILIVQGRINSFGPVIMAAFAAAVKIDSFAYMPLQDFGNAFSTFIAQNYGAQQPERIRRGIRTAVLLSSVFAVCVSACVVLLAAPLLGLFLQPGETEILQAGVTYLRIAGAFYVGIGGLFLLYGLYRAVGRPGMSLVLTVISLGTRVALAYALSAVPAIGVVGIWWSIPIGWALADLTGVLVWRRAGRKLTENSHPGAKMR